MSFKDMWQVRYPGAYYHVMDGSKISQGAWDRNDFPFERFFSDNVDESVLDGIDLSNVRREAAKYLGNVDIKVKKNEFSVTVLLQERSNHE